MKSRHWTIIALIMLCLGASLGQQKAIGEGRTFQYDTAETRLEGRLMERKVYGPPGYGETPTKDKRGTILVLKLPYTITVEPTIGAKEKNSSSLDTIRDIREVQLFIPRDRTAAAHALIGRKIVAIGTLNESVAPSQYTKVWLDVKTIGAD